MPQSNQCTDWQGVEDFATAIREIRKYDDEHDKILNKTEQYEDPYLTGNLEYYKTTKEQKFRLILPRQCECGGVGRTTEVHLP